MSRAHLKVEVPSGSLEYRKAFKTSTLEKQHEFLFAFSNLSFPPPRMWPAHRPLNVLGENLRSIKQKHFVMKFTSLHSTTANFFQFIYSVFMSKPKLPENKG